MNGSLSNFNEESNKLIHPEIALPKLHVKTTRTKYYSLSKQHQVGTQESSEIVHTHNGNIKEKQDRDFMYKK